MLVNRKEKCMKIEAGVKRLETEVDEISKRMAGIQLKIEQSCVTLKQVNSRFKDEIWLLNVNFRLAG